MQAIQIKLLPSNLLLGLLLAISIVACAIIVILPIAMFFKLLIIALILVSSAYFILRDAFLMLPWSWKTIDVDNKGGLKITNKRGQVFQPTLAASSFIHAACTILNFKRERIKFALTPVILMANAESENELRRLRVWLRWFKHHDSAEADLAA